ncbi:hypothetical protein OS121_22685 [Mycolicibacterium mucogenicum]|nr:hypothetical protein [Mycolicibacterium mucogenicum]MCX8557861.1 hypothetical protein [Mycolicibacterium mucogenicum]
MPDFSPVITDYWTAAFSGKTLHRNEHLTITLKPDLDHDERVAILRSADDKPASVVVSPALADALIKDIAALGNPTAADTEDTQRRWCARCFAMRSWRDTSRSTDASWTMRPRTDWPQVWICSCSGSGKPSCPTMSDGGFMWWSRLGSNQ